MSGLSQQSIKRGAVADLTLQPFPPAIRIRDPKLGEDLEAWRRQAETTLHNTIMALKLDTGTATSSGLPATGNIDGGHAAPF